jgi:hypothetical protein
MTTVCAAASVALALAAAAATPAALFSDATLASGLDFTYVNGAAGELHLPEIMGPGAALFDFDNDGDLDVFFVQGGPLGPKGEPPAPRAKPAPPGEGDRLFRNDLAVHADGRRELRFTDVTEAAGLTTDGYGLGVAAGDFDNDGFVDLYVLRYGGNRLLRNAGGQRFEDVTARAGVADPGWSDSATFFDYDRDGRLDLFVVHYVDYEPVKCLRASTRRDYCGPKSYRPRVDHLFHNLGDGRFEDVTKALMAPERAGPGLGVVSADVDGDGWLDLYVANDGFDNFLWLNRQGRGFREEGLLAGVALNRAGQAEAGMGIDAGDAAGDGREDLFVTNLTAETNTLYVNLGDGLFEDRTLAADLGPASLPHTGFGTRFIDYDNDGALDLVAVNGAVHLPDEATDVRDLALLGQPKLLFRNTGRATFADVSAQAGEAFARREVSRGLAAGDVDNDGDPDLVVANNVGLSRLLLNQVGQDAPWLGLRVLTADGRRDALGARVTLRRRGAPDLVRRAHADGSYASSSDPRVLFGLSGGADVTGVDVRWPDGTSESFPAPPLRRYRELRQGQAGRAPEP